MTAVIIEDEPSAVFRMRKLLKEVEPAITIDAELSSIEETVEWFRKNPAPDLAFFDVRLSDGDSFQVFDLVDVECPVIFCTAYDEYALRAFKVHALDYLLKPIKRADLASAVARANQFRVVRDHSALIDRTEKAGIAPVKRFLIRYGDQFKVVEPERIAYFHSLLKNTFLRTKEGKDLPVDESLDKLEGQLDPDRFSRLNRQLLVQIDSIRDLIAHSKSRVNVMLEPPYEEEAVVSSERTPGFKKWLAGG